MQGDRCACLKTNVSQGYGGCKSFGVIPEGLAAFQPGLMGSAAGPSRGARPFCCVFRLDAKGRMKMRGRGGGSAPARRRAAKVRRCDGRCNTFQRKRNATKNIFGIRTRPRPFCPETRRPPSFRHLLSWVQVRPFWGQRSPGRDPWQGRQTLALFRAQPEIRLRAGCCTGNCGGDAGFLSGRPSTQNAKLVSRQAPAQTFVRRALTRASFILRSRSSSVIGLASPKGLLFAEEGAGPATASIGAVLLEHDGGREGWGGGVGAT